MQIPNLKKKIVILAATGPSLTQTQLMQARKTPQSFLVSVNKVYQECPDADMLYACDGDFWDEYQPEFDGIKVTQDSRSAEKYNCIYTPGDDLPGLSFDSQRISLGMNSGFQALDIVIKNGAQNIILIGYDMKLSDDSKRHYFGDYPQRCNLQSQYHLWMPYYETAAKQVREHGIRVINSTPNSALTCFEMLPLTEALALCESAL